MLALLAIEGERSGYDLLKRVRSAIGHVWTPARSHLYAVLPRLVAAGHATGRSVAQTTRPDKTLYRITPAGRAALDEWLESEPTDRETFLLRLFVGGLVRRESLVDHVERFRERTAAALDELRAIEPTNTREGHDYFHYFVLRFGIEQYELHRAWAEWVLEELRRRPE